MSSVTLVAAISAATLSLAPTTVICQQTALCAWNRTTNVEPTATNHQINKSPISTTGTNTNNAVLTSAILGEL